MNSGVNLHIGGEQAVFPNPDQVVVQQHAVGVDKGVFSYFDIDSKIAEERRLDPDSSVDFPQKLVEKLGSLIPIAGVGVCSG